VKVVIKKFDPDKHAGLIISSMPKGIYHSPAIPILMNKDKWFHEFYKDLVEHIKTYQIWIAGIKDDDHTILGYSMFNGPVLEWVYVKELFRKEGLATALVHMQRFDSVNTANLTKVGKAILEVQEAKKEKLDGNEGTGPEVIEDDHARDRTT
jgi:hypothetical protein